MRRAEQRRTAVFALYQHDLTGRPIELAVGHDAQAYVREVAHGVVEQQAAIDAEIERHAKGWSLERIAPLERAILRTALYEVEHRADIPDEVAVDQAIELAKEFCGAEAPGFVNGILGAVMRERAQNASEPS